MPKNRNTDDASETVFRRFLRSEVTWFLFVLGIVLSAYAQLADIKTAQAITNEQMKQLVDNTGDIFARMNAYDVRLREVENENAGLKKEIEIYKAIK